MPQKAWVGGNGSEHTPRLPSRSECLVPTGLPCPPPLQLARASGHLSSFSVPDPHKNPPATRQNTLCPLLTAGPPCSVWFPKSSSRSAPGVAALWPARGDSTSGRAACLPSAQSVCESWEGFRYLGLSQNLLDPLAPIVPARDLGNGGRRRWLKFATNFATWARLCAHVHVHVMLGCCVRGSAPPSLNLQLIYVLCRSNQATERSGEEVNLIN